MGHADVMVTLCCWMMTSCGKQSACEKRFSTLSVLCKDRWLALLVYFTVCVCAHDF